MADDLQSAPRAASKAVSRASGARVIKQRPITFRCQWCGQLVTELRFPGPTPIYGLACKTEAQRYAEASKKARQRHATPPAARRTTSCWDSPTNLLIYGYVDPHAEEAAQTAIAARQHEQAVQHSLAARAIDRADDEVRQFLEECGL